MVTHVAVALAVILAVLALTLWGRSIRLRREHFIRTFVLPSGLYEKLQKQHPQLEYKDCSLIARGLRKFFLAYLNSGCRFVSMPSQVVDDLWHEFILHTRAYDQFCSGAFGRFLHHVPATVLDHEKSNNEGLRRVWWHACKEENINPKNPARLPLLFALDTKLNIANGFKYSPDCKRSRDKPGVSLYCGGDFSSTAVDGSLDGFGHSSDFSLGSMDFGGGGGDSGCGGGGCGGGGCGGGD